jgi:succinoglycan biosynthesis protein ExoM
MGVDVSICIATYRRPEGLSRLLDSLERLKLPTGIRIETIIVDNDRDASAASVVQSRSGLLEAIHYCVEPRQNIALARNRALSQASGEWILFIDDDEIADENWITEYLKLVERPSI